MTVLVWLELSDGDSLIKRAAAWDSMTQKVQLRPGITQTPGHRVTGSAGRDIEAVSALQGPLMPWPCPGHSPALCLLPQPYVWGPHLLPPASLRCDYLASLKAAPGLGFHRQHNCYPLVINWLESLRIQRVHVNFEFLTSLEILEDVMIDLHG